ncbi:hypothetical protein ACHAAC_03430 [Aeromicrobium sp. CF4.19]|uniref:hypothetical protein n=1 Tax=Aeromicrobium sp. CF4.19 TaxID=3373082 RepID=UPI003EE80214
MPWLIALIFLVGAIVSILAVITARRGQVTHSKDGYGVPAHVSSDPELRKQANDIVAWWGTLLAGLCLAPVGFMIWVIVREVDDPVTMPMLIVLGVYGLLIATLAAYPFEKIKRL